MWDDEFQQNFEAKCQELRQTTQIVLTTDDDHEGKFWLYSQGMKENYEIEDLEIKDVPGMFVNAAGILINEINAYRLISGKTVEVGDTMSWATGEILVVQGEAWNGSWSWEAEDMLRLTSRLTDVECCAGCEVKDAGITE
tara:strand:- start:10222 stop:10641 length:420 start_codon:yes stop_codon:yes gene_type:complete